MYKKSVTKGYYIVKEQKKEKKKTKLLCTLWWSFVGGFFIFLMTAIGRCSHRLETSSKYQGLTMAVAKKPLCCLLWFFLKEKKWNGSLLLSMYILHWHRSHMTWYSKFSVTSFSTKRFTDLSVQISFHTYFKILD